jgi:ribosomal protein S9
MEEPIRITESIIGKIEFDCEITTKGGGEKSQIDAARLAMAKAIIDFTKSDNSSRHF